MKRSTSTLSAEQPDIELVFQLVPDDKIGLRRIEFVLNAPIQTLTRNGLGVRC